MTSARPRSTTRSGRNDGWHGGDFNERFLRTLAFNHDRLTEREIPHEIVLVEYNEDYCEVARKLLPQAEVINGSIYDPVLIAELTTRGFRTVVSNPPFGTVSKPKGASGPRYKGDAHYEAIDIASDLADNGVFILPHQACPFAYSGRQNFIRVDNDRYEKFSKTTGIELELGASTDTSVLTPFRSTTITVEIVEADFLEARERRKPAQAELGLAA